ncbi:MAG: arylsulfatase [Rhodobacterales bacterium]|nr:arylsulfatase [Rhodobacterales bacterium]
MTKLPSRMRRAVTATAIMAGMLSVAAVTTVQAQDAAKPNIVIIWGDDIGQFNISAYNLGMMGYHTPNIDRIAAEGALFTDWYGEQSCTAGRASFITGQAPIRTGLTKVGLPGAPEGMPAEDPTLATLLGAEGYMTGQFGKNHLGDRNEHFPTVHGFDEFFGNLYHLNAEEEPENVDYPQDPAFREAFGPRGVMDCVATDADTEAPDPRFGAWGNQRCIDTGPLTRERMETIDDVVLARSIDFMDRAVTAQKPFFLWFNSTRMHVFTHLKPESQGVTGLGVYADGMTEHDKAVGAILDEIDRLGIADNTIVMYSTDNGAETFTWPDGGTTMFRGEKNTQWEGGYRVPMAMRWPGVIEPGTVVNEIGSHMDMLPTIMAATGDTTVVDDLKAGLTVDGVTYKSHLDGFNLMPFFQGLAEWPRDYFIYWTDGGSVAALRYGNWKATFLRQDATGLSVWIEPFTVLRAPMLTNLRMDPFELAADEGAEYDRWFMERMFMIAPAGAFIADWLQSFREFPPRQAPGSFNLDNVMKAVTAGSNQ